jgi:hypothetical protein
MKFQFSMENATGSIWFFPQISQMSAENISAKISVISVISGKQIFWSSSKLKLSQHLENRLFTGTKLLKRTSHEGKLNHEREEGSYYYPWLSEKSR